MNKYLMIFASLCATIHTAPARSQAVVQRQSSVSLNAGASVPFLFNRSDDDPSIKTKGKLGINAELLYTIDKINQKKGFSGISIGIGYQPVHYTRRSIYSSTAYTGISEGDTRLKYLTLPVMANFVLQRRNAITWSLSGGLKLSYLINYIDDIAQTTQYPSGTSIIIDTRTENKELESTITDNGTRLLPNGLHQYAILSQPIFNPLILSALLRTGVDYSLNHKMAVGVSVNAGYSINDVEKKGTIGVANQLQYVFQDDRYYFDGRAPQHILNLDFLLTFKYKL